MTSRSSTRPPLPHAFKKILVIELFFRASGGGNAVTANVVEALKRDYAITLLTWEPVDIKAINRTFCTSLGESEFKVRLPPYIFRLMIRIPNDLLSIRYGILLRLCKKIRNDYDVIISVNNEADFGRRGIQYVHDPPYWLSLMSKGHGRDRPLSRDILTGQVGHLLRWRYRPWMVIAGFSYYRMKSNLTVVNSDWTGAELKKIYGIESRTVHPPVAGHFPDTHWEERENGFLCIGRIVPWKQLEKVCQIVGHVKRTFHEVHLHIIGTPDDRMYRKRMYHEIRDKPWITISENISRGQLIQLISTHRYGIHGMIDEPFGIAVAEMVQGGCIVFAHRTGGPKEILGENDHLLYHTADEAARKIVRVMASEALQVSIRKSLRSRRNLFTQAIFQQRIREIVGEFSRDATRPRHITNEMSQSEGQ